MTKYRIVPLQLHLNLKLFGYNEFQASTISQKIWDRDEQHWENLGMLKSWENLIFLNERLP